MTVQLGTVAAVGFDDFPPAEWLPLFRELGCTVSQAYRNQSGNISIPQMAEAIESGGLPCDSLHGVYGEQYDPSAPVESQRRYAVETFKAEGEMALALGGPLVVVHCATTRPDGISTSEHDLRIDQLKRSIEELGRFGQSRGVNYAFENLPAYHAIGYDVQELTDVIRDVGAPNTGICLDTGHANMVSDASEAIRIASDRIIYVHFSDNSGKSDDHDMPLYGTLACDSVARALHDVGYQGTLMLEVFYKPDRMRELIAEGCGERLAEVMALANGRDQ